MLKLNAKQIYVELDEDDADLWNEFITFWLRTK